MAVVPHSSLPKLKDILGELTNLKVSNVFELGIQLGLSFKQLRYIEAKYPRDIQRQLTEVIIEWGNLDGEYCWEKLGQALKCVPGHFEEGQQILTKYIVDHSESVVGYQDRSGGKGSACCSLPVNRVPMIPALSNNLTSLPPPSGVTDAPPSPSVVSNPLDASITTSSNTSTDVSSGSYIISFPPSYSNFHPPNILPLNSLPPNSLPPVPPHVHPVLPCVLPPVCLPPVHPPPSFVSHPSDTSINTSSNTSTDVSSSTISFPSSHLNSHIPVPHPPPHVSSHVNPYPSYNLHSSSISPSPSLASVSSQNSSVIILSSGEQRLPPHHPFLLPPHYPHSDGIPNQSIKETKTALKKIIRLQQKFTNLCMKVADLMNAANIDIAEIKRFLMLSHFEKQMLESEQTINDIIIFLQRFTSYDNPSIIRKLVYQFVEETGGDLMDQYEKELDEFFECCPCFDYARALTEFLELRNMECSRTHSSDQVTVHFNSSWERRPVSDLRAFQKRKFGRFSPYLKNVKIENRSILVVWKTTEIVVWELAKDLVKRLSYLKGEGIEQIIIGDHEIDFSFSDDPQFYQIKTIETPSDLLRSVSSLTLKSNFSEPTETSADTAGYISSGSKSISSIITESQFQYGHVDNNFTSDTLQVKKGDKVTIVTVRGLLALIKTAHDIYGYIPLSLLKEFSSNKSPIIPNTTSEVIVRKRVSTLMMPQPPSITSLSPSLSLEKREEIIRSKPSSGSTATERETDISDSFQRKQKGWVGKTSHAIGHAVKDITKDPLKMAKKTLTSLMTKAWKKQKNLRILVTGKTGQGKSTLINGILGSKVAIEGAGATRCTTEVTVYSKTIEGVPIKVFDSPGLQDRTSNEEEYIRGMREKCQELSLILYCTKMTNTRLTDDDKSAMIKLTKAFGEKFWEFTVFVLTFANQENVERKDDRDEDEIEPDHDDEEGWKELMKRRFEGRLRHWKEGLHQFLINEVGVSTDIVVNIPLVPTGDSKTTRTNKYPLRLPDRENWFTSYWETCCLRVKETRLFLKINSERIVSDDRQGADDQPDEEDSEDEGIEDDETESDDLLTMDLSSLLNVKERSVIEQQLQLRSPVEKTSPKPAVSSKPQNLLQENASESSRNRASAIKSPPPPTLPKPKRDKSGVLLRRDKQQESPQSRRQAVSMVLIPKDPPDGSRIRSESLTSSTPPAAAPKNLILNQSIHMHPTLVREVTTQTMRRSGIQETFIKGAEMLIGHMKKPGKWLMSIFQRKTR